MRVRNENESRRDLSQCVSRFQSASRRRMNAQRHQKIEYRCVDFAQSLRFVEFWSNCLIDVKKNYDRVLNKYEISWYRASKMKEIVYDKSIDIWNMKILFYRLTYHYHSWNYIKNSWIEQFSMKDNNNKSNKYLQRRQEWRNQYNVVICRMSHDAQQTISTFTFEFLHRKWFYFMCQFLKISIMKRS